MPNNVVDIIKSYAKKLKRPQIKYATLVSYLAKLADSQDDDQLFSVADKPQIYLDPLLEEMERDGQVELQRDQGGLESILMIDQLKNLINQTYDDIENDNKVPFPTESTLGISIPAEVIEIINVKSDFIKIVNTEQEFGKKILKITFPENIKGILVTKEILPAKLLVTSVHKLNHYLQFKINSNYIYSRLVSLFRGREKVLNESLNDLLTKPSKSFATLQQPDDFSFKFWAHFANLILQDFKKKDDKTKDEQDYCGAAYFIGYYIIYQKGVIHKNQQQKSDLKNLDLQLKKPPYAYTLQDFYNLKDSKGVQYVKKYSRQFIIGYLDQRTKTEDKTKLPELIRLKLDKNKEYFIHQDLIIPLFLKKLHNASQELRHEYILQWKELIRHNKKTPAMASDVPFLLELETKIEEYHKLLHALLNPSLLYITKEKTQISPTTKDVIDKCFEKDSKLKTLDILLDISRKEITKEALNSLPIWYSIPVIKQFMFFFKALFKPKPQAHKEEDRREGPWAKPSTDQALDNQAAGVDPSRKMLGTTQDLSRPQTARERAAEFKDAIIKLKNQVVGEHVSIDARIKELAGKWNPLYDEAAKKNLVEDVNSLIRDFLRSLRKGFRYRPPTAQRLSNLARELSEKRALGEIKKKEYLKQYIEVYMVKTIGQKYL